MCGAHRYTLPTLLHTQTGVEREVPVTKCHFLIVIRLSGWSNTLLDVHVQKGKREMSRSGLKASVSVSPVFAVYSNIVVVPFATFDMVTTWPLPCDVS